MNLSSILKGLFCVTLIAGLTACNKDGACPGNGGSDFLLTIKDQSTTLPSNVTIFFKVDQRDGKPVPGLSEANFSIYEKGRNDECELPISAFESNAQILLDPQVFVYCTALILDLSGSVTQTALNELKTSAKTFIDEVLPSGQAYDSYKMGIWWFDGSPDLKQLVATTSNVTNLKNAIDGIDANISQDNSTNLYGAVVLGTDLAAQGLLAFQNQNILSASSVVIFTDGRDQAGIVAKQSALDAVTAANDNISFFTIGLGGEIDQTVLSQIGQDGTAFAADSDDLEATFTEIANLVFEEANSYYLFTYCSPKRDGSGLNELKIVATLGQESGGLTTSFNATDFTSGCN
ncbi:MAG: vWA domain-containing protein [Bacteroidota bacterium]